MKRIEDEDKFLDINIGDYIRSKIDRDNNSSARKVIGFYCYKPNSFALEKYAKKTLDFICSAIRLNYEDNSKSNEAYGVICDDGQIERLNAFEFIEKIQ